MAIRQPQLAVLAFSPYLLSTVHPSREGDCAQNPDGL